MKALNRLTTRRFPATDVYTIDQARELSLLSRALGRQLGMLIDRKGRVDMVLVGEAGGILIPELPRARSGADRLRGLRLLHTHLTPDGLSQEDLMDLLFLRLDAIIVLTVNPDGDPVQWQEAHLLPTPVAGQPYRVEQLRPWDQTSAHFAATAEALEEELARRSDDTREASDAPRALLVSVAAQPRIIQERNLDELAELARTAGLAVAGRMVQRVAQVNPKFILGKGKMAELEVLALEGRAGTLVFDGELSPAQLHNLADITERTQIEKDGDDARYTEDGGETWTHLPGDTPVSLNLWGFTASFMAEAWNRFPAFLDGALKTNPLKGEYFLPSVVSQLIGEGRARVKVLKSRDKWYGVTYKEDKPVVVSAIAEKTAAGLYPDNLWEGK